MPRALTVITPFGRAELTRFQRDLARSVDELARLRAPGPTIWSRTYDRSGAFTLRWSPRHVEVEDLPFPDGGRTGPGATRNRALAEAADGWLVALDSDDVLVPDAFAAFVDAVRDSGYRWGAALADDTDEQGRVIYRGPDLVNSPVTPRNYFLDCQDLHGSLPWLCSGAVVLDTALVTECGGWADDPRLPYSDDVALMARVSARAEGLWFPRAVMRYRRHPGSVTAAPAFRVTEDEAALVRRYAQS